MGVKALHKAMDEFEWYRRNNGKQVDFEVYLGDVLFGVMHGTLVCDIKPDFTIEDIRFIDCIFVETEDDQID